MTVKPTVAARLVALLVAAALGTAACVSGGGPRVVEVAPVRGPASLLHPGSTDAEALGVVAALLVDRLGLPLPSPVHARFYASRDALELGLVTDGRITDRAIARDQARFATGVGTAHGIFLRGDRLAGAPLPARVGLFAHELAHVSQYALAGGRRGESDQWLREGFADWVKFHALEFLGLRPYAESRREVARGVARLGVARLPALGALVSNREWVSARNDLGGAATYGQAFLATDWLVERTSPARAVEYFRRSGHRADRVGNFRDAFGLPPDRFVEEFRARLPALLAGA